MKFELPPLPFAIDALEPVISAETLNFHYGKHHQAYVNNLNNLIVGTKFENDHSLEDIIMEADGAIFNNAAQVWNHSFYWESLGVKSTSPSAELLDTIIRDFGSYEDFVRMFTEACVKLFGSGWVWLMKDTNGKLSIMQTSNAANPMTDGFKPLLTCDVWEHAYYIDYQNRRPDYVAKFMGIINWKVVSERM